MNGTFPKSFLPRVFQLFLIPQKKKLSLNNGGNAGEKFAVAVNYKISLGMFVIGAQTASDTSQLFNKAFVLI